VRVEEAVFSSSEDRIRASQAIVPTVGTAIVLRKAILSLANRAAESLFTVLFPSDCRICGTPLCNVSRLPVCGDGLDGIQPLSGKLCSICGERVFAPHIFYSDSGAFLCRLCQAVQPPFAKAVAYGRYEEGLRDLIHLLKCGGVRPAANVLGRMLSEAIVGLDSGLGKSSIAVVAVPLHKTRLRQRGFNQAELIARAALKLNAADGRLQFSEGTLVRRRETRSQIGMTPHQRRENIRGAFAVARLEAVKGREILLVDDVYTTGATASECARVLIRAGAVRVWVATVARTPRLASQYTQIETQDDVVEDFVERVDANESQEVAIAGR
jgi:ComF family protein